MASKASAAKPFLLLNLLCYVLSTTAACVTCGTPFPPYLTPPPTGGRGGGGGGGGSTPTPPGGGGPSPPATCPRDALQLGVCANLLGGLLGVVIGNPPVTPCCTLLAGLADLEAAVCLCTVIRANVLGIINLNVPIALSLLLNVCGRTPPAGFVCPN